MDMSTRKEQPPVKVETAVQRGWYICRDKILVSMEKLKSNYDVQFANGLSSYVNTGDLTNTRASQCQCSKVLDVRPKKEQT